MKQIFGISENQINLSSLNELELVKKDIKKIQKRNNISLK